MLAKKTPHFFTYGNHPIAKLPDYLDSMIRKIVKETSFQDSESAKQLLASMEVKPVAAASASSTNTSTEESKGELKKHDNGRPYRCIGPFITMGSWS